MEADPEAALRAIQEWTESNRRLLREIASLKERVSALEAKAEEAENGTPQKVLPRLVN